MLAATKNNERNYDIKSPFARHRCTHSVGHSRSIKGSAISGKPYVSFSDWSLHRSRRMGRWSIYGAALRHKFLTPWDVRPRGAHGKSGRVWTGNDVKNLARCEMKQFLIEQIPVLFFIAVFFLILALGG